MPIENEDLCSSCEKPLDGNTIDDTFKDAVQMDVPGVGMVYYDVNLRVCAHCGEVVDRYTYVSR